MAKYIAPGARVQNLDFAKAWEHLEDRERNYAYWMSKASWAGAKMVFHQISYESPIIFIFLQSYFQGKNFNALEKACIEATKDIEAEKLLTEQTGLTVWQRFMAYSAGFYGNMSNYHSFGAMKFIPQMEEATFEIVLRSYRFEQKETDECHRQKLDDHYESIKKEIFCVEKPYTQLGFPHEGGVTAYFGKNMNAEDLALCSKFMKQNNIDVLNTRQWKDANGEYYITIGSIEQDETTGEMDGKKFTVKRGEFRKHLEEMNEYLTEALKYVANETQERMLQKYIESYKTGSIAAHKDSQREWIRDKGPVVETNMGWIETYIDPENVRAYYEGWVAIVDKEKSKKFQQLVTNSEQIIPLLPWPKEQEKDKFMAPDFTTLEIICFATNGCPLGINIPNYDDIRQEEGFKNLFLNNSLGSYAQSAVEFATTEQAAILTQYTIRCYEVHVACHELLGHGVGKLIYRDDKNVLMFKDPLTGENVESCYEQGEVWNTKFGSISTSYEECRADTCGYFLCTLPEVYTLFGIEESEVPTMLWTNVMNQLRKGVLGLTLYNPETKKWGQAHTNGAWVITQFIYQNQKTEIIKFEFDEAKGDFLIHLNQENLMQEGKDLIRQLLLVLNAYKSYGAVERGTKFYNHYSKVDDYFLKVRDLVLTKKKPRRIELNNNLVRYDEKNIMIQSYPETFEGIVASFQDRYPFCETNTTDIINEHWEFKLGNGEKINTMLKH